MGNSFFSILSETGLNSTDINVNSAPLPSIPTKKEKNKSYLMAQFPETENKREFTIGDEESKDIELNLVSIDGKNNRTKLIRQNLNRLLLKETKSEYIKQIKYLKNAIVKIRSDSIKLANDIDFHVNNLLLCIDDIKEKENKESFTAILNEMLRIDVVKRIDEVLDTNLEDNILTRDLYNYYKSFMNTLIVKFQLVKGESKKANFNIIRMHFLLNNLSDNLESIRHSDY